MTMFTAQNRLDSAPSAAPQSLKVQHAVVVRNPEHLRKLNELLASGWRVVQTVPFEMGAALLVIEAEGDAAAVQEFRNVFGAPVGNA